MKSTYEATKAFLINIQNLQIIQDGLEVLILGTKVVYHLKYMLKHSHMYALSPASVNFNTNYSS